MKRIQGIVLGIALIAGMPSGLLYGQMIEENEDSKLNTNVAFTLAAPTHPTSAFSDFGWGLTVGAGYNFTENPSHHALVGEFMWNRLHIKDQALVPLRLALQNPEIHGHS